MLADYIPGYVPVKVCSLLSQKAVVVRKDGRYLVLRRSDKCSRAGGWDLAGGALNLGEDPVISIFREIQEETGLTPSRVWPIHLTSQTTPHNEFRVMVGYRAEVEDGPIRLSWEHDAFQWLTQAEVLALEWPAAHRSFIERAEMLKESPQPFLKK